MTGSEQSELKRFERALLKRSIVMVTAQLVAMVLAIFGAGSYVSYRNSLLIKQLDKRFDRMEKTFDDQKNQSDRERREGKSKETPHVLKD